MLKILGLIVLAYIRTLSRLSHCTEYNEIRHGDILLINGHRLFFTATTDTHAGGDAGK